MKTRKLHRKNKKSGSCCIAERRIIEIFSLVALISVSMILVVLLYSGPFVFYDDTVYIIYAHQMLEGSFNPLKGFPFSANFIMIGIEAVFIALFGDNALAVEMPSLISLVIMIILTYLIGKKVYGSSLGFVSAAFITVSPITVGYATRVLPDLMSGMFAALLIYMIVATKSSEHHKLLSFLAGVLAPLLIAVKTESAFFVIAIILFIAIYEIHAKQKYRAEQNQYKINIKLATIGFLIGLIILFGYFFIYSGKISYWVLKYGASNMLFAHSTIAQNIHSLLVFLDPYTFFGGMRGYRLDCYVFPMGLLFDLMIIGSVIFIAFRKWDIMLFAIPCLVVILLLFFAPETLNSYTIATVIDRFLIIILPLMALVAGYTLIVVYNLLKKRKSLALLFLVIVITYIFVANIPEYYSTYRYNLTSAFALHAYQNII
ncbi:MAG: ArnT family glycosyltransferase, partial [Candidatus Micrarchaeia archaeon]